MPADCKAKRRPDFQLVVKSGWLPDLTRLERVRTLLFRAGGGQRRMRSVLAIGPLLAIVAVVSTTPRRGHRHRPLVRRGLRRSGLRPGSPPGPPGRAGPPGGGNPPRRAEPPLECQRGAEPERRDGGDRGGDCLAFHRAISASEGTKDCARRAIVAGIPTGPGRTTRGSPPWTRTITAQRLIRPVSAEIIIATPTRVPRTGIILVESPEEFPRVESGNDRPGTGDRPCDHEPRS